MAQSYDYLKMLVLYDYTVIFDLEIWKIAFVGIDRDSRSNRVLRVNQNFI
jgi:hypothetical protein